MNFMSLERQVPKDPQQQVNWLAGYVFWSYHFSQGRPTIQNAFDQRVIDLYQGAEKALLTHKDKVIEDAAKRILRFLTLGNGKNHPVGTAATRHSTIIESDDRVASLLTARTTDRRTRGIDLLRVIIGRDESNLAKDGKRLAPTHPNFGKSIVLAHLVDGRNAHHQVFNDYFADLRQQVVETQDYAIICRLTALDEREAELLSAPVRDVASFFLQSALPIL